MAKATPKNSGTQSAEGPLAPPIPPIHGYPADDRSSLSSERARETAMYSPEAIQVPISVVAAEQFVTAVS